MKLTSTRLILDDAQLVGLVPDYTVSGPSGRHRARLVQLYEQLHE
jgi:hypothetical protein